MSEAPQKINGYQMKIAVAFVLFMMLASLMIFNHVRASYLMHEMQRAEKAAAKDGDPGKEGETPPGD